MELLVKTGYQSLKTEDGDTALSRVEILKEVEKFYGHLYTSVIQAFRSSGEDLVDKLIRHYFEGIPDIRLREISVVLGELKTRTCPA
ncbi:unnamed protein product [Euphydryas editha]|uniref:Uncharacterized protein n=1 Tax=Euphydryas editha TaxID=104508 RepID=A0AAU9UXH2_EUPED|nr:unnamed protein product [Euphydryas editha]